MSYQEENYKNVINLNEPSSQNYLKPGNEVNVEYYNISLNGKENDKNNLPVKINYNQRGIQDKQIETENKGTVFVIPSNVNTCFSIFVLIVNIFIPGLGTIFLGCFMPIPGIDEEEAAGLGCLFVCLGISQFFLTICIIGWVWSIATGILLVQASFHK